MLNPGSKSFTLKINGRANVLITEAIVHPAFDPKKVTSQPPGVKFNAIWDTGATNTVITEKVVSDCDLKPISMAEVHTAGGKVTKPVYLINIVLRNGLGVQQVRVTEGEITGKVEVLIGMDIISLGDFAVTNKDGKTTFSFRTPSTECIDFVAQANAPAVSKKVARNAPCPCGSGKKYKKCCGKIPTS